MVQIKTLKFTFEIYWPLETVEKNSGKRSSKHNFARGILDEVAHVCRVAKASRQQQLPWPTMGWINFSGLVLISNSENLIPYYNLIKGIHTTQKLFSKTSNLQKKNQTCQVSKPYHVKAMFNILAFKTKKCVNSEFNSSLLNTWYKVMCAIE